MGGEKAMQLDKVWEGAEVNDTFKYVVYFQPIVAGAFTKHEHVVGCEALVRKEGNDEKLISPAHFLDGVPDNERLELETFIFDQVCALQNSADDPQFTIAYNIDPQMPCINALLEHINSKEGIDKSRIKMELHERRLPADHDAREKIYNILKSLNDDGFPVAIDDFGTGGANIERVNEMLKRGFKDITVKLDISLMPHQNIDTFLQTLHEHEVSKINNQRIQFVFEGATAKDMNRLRTFHNFRDAHVQSFDSYRPMPASNITFIVDLQNTGQDHPPEV